MSTELLDQSPLHHEWVDKARAEELRYAVRTVLKGRFQTLDVDLLGALEMVTPNALKETLRHIISDSLDQAPERLRQS